MTQSAAGAYRQEKWYNKNIFPLVPVLQITKADEHNTANFSLRWLFFTFWSLDNVQFELTLIADTHWGIGFVGLLPYLRWVITIPCPEKLGIWFDRNTSRNNMYKRKIK